MSEEETIYIRALLAYERILVAFVKGVPRSALCGTMGSYAFA